MYYFLSSTHVISRSLVMVDVNPPSFSGGSIVLVSGRLARPICGGIWPAAATSPAPPLLPLPLLPLRLPRGGGRRGPFSPSVIRCHRRSHCGGRGVVHGQCRGGPQRQGAWLGQEWLIRNYESRCCVLCQSLDTMDGQRLNFPPRQRWKDLLNINSTICK